MKLPTLLVIADNPTIRFWIKKHLDDRFFILNAGSRQEALGAIEARLDFIIVDADFAAYDSLLLCKELQKRLQKQLVPILLITGRLKKSFRDKAKASGVTDFLSDQLDAEELAQKIISGMSAAQAREKTLDLGLSIQPPKLGPSSSLKGKFVLNDRALKLIAEAKAEKIPVACLLLRIDNQEVEKQILTSQLFEFISPLLRRKDVLLPAPEQEIAILLFQMTPDLAKMVAERLKGKIEGHLFELNGKKEKITVSIVVSSFEASEQGLSRMVISAAKSLKAHSENSLIIAIDQDLS